MTTTKNSTPVTAVVSATNWIVNNALDIVSAQNKITQLSVPTAPSNSGNTYMAHVDDVTSFMTGNTSLFYDADPDSKLLILNDISGFKPGDGLAIIEGENINAYGGRYTADGYITENMKITAVGTTYTSTASDFYPYVLASVYGGATGIANVYYPTLLSSSTLNFVSSGQAISGSGILVGTTILYDYTDTSLYPGGSNNSIPVIASGSSGATTVTFSTVPSSVVVGLGISGTGIAPGTVITNITGTTITLSQATLSAISSAQLIVSGYVLSNPSTLNAGTSQDGVILALGGSANNSIQTIPIASITTATTSTSTIVTIVTSSAHGFSSGDSITIAGISPSGFNGTFKISVTNTTTFTYTVNSSISSPTFSSATATKTITSNISAISETSSNASQSFVTQSSTGDAIDMAIDTSQGYFYTTDNTNQTIWRTTSGGQVTSYVSGQSVKGIAYNSNQLYFSDGINTVYKVSDTYAPVSITNIVPSVVNSGSPTVSTVASVGAGTSASYPNTGLCTDTSGNFYTVVHNIVSNSDQIVIKKITPSGTVTTFQTFTWADGAEYTHTPVDLAVDGSGNVYIYSSDGWIYKATGTSYTGFLGISSSTAGAITYDPVKNVLYATNYSGTSFYKISMSGVASNIGTVYANTIGIVCDASGNIYTADSSGHILKTTPSGTTTVILSASSNPYNGYPSIAIDPTGLIYVCDNFNEVLYTVSQSGAVTLIGSNSSYLGYPEYKNGALYVIPGNASTSPGNLNKILFSTDIATVTTSTSHGFTTGNTITITGNSVSTYNGSWTVTVTGTTTFTYVTPTLGASTGTGGTASGAGGTVSTFATGFNQPTNLAWDNAGSNLYISNAGNNTISVVSSSGGTASTFCSTGITSPGPLQWDSTGTYLYVLSLSGNGPIYRVTTSGVASVWTPVTVSGVGNTFIVGMTFDASKTNVYTVDSNGNVFQIPVSTGVPSLFATTYNDSASSIRCDLSGNLYVSFRAYPSTPFAILRLVPGTFTTVTVTTSSNNVFTTGQSITIAGVSPSAYNGSYSITSLSTTQFSYVISSNPGNATLSSATASLALSSPIASASATSGGATYLATATTSSANSIATKTTVYISNASISGYDGSHVVTSTGASTFTFPVLSALSSSTGGYVSVTSSVSGTSGGSSAGGTLAITSISGSAGVATVTTPSSNSLTLGQSITISGDNASTSTGATSISVGSVVGGYSGSTPTSGVATFTTGVPFTGSTTSGSPTITNVTNISNLSVGLPVLGTNMASGATITAVGTSTVTVSANATATTTPGTSGNFVGVKPASLGVGSTINIQSGGVQYNVLSVQGNVPPSTGSAVLRTTAPFYSQLTTGSKISIQGIPELSGSISSTTAVTGSSGLVTVTTTAPHGLSSGDTVNTNISGSSGSISQIVGNGTIATVTTSLPHGLSTGTTVAISGIDANVSNGNVVETIQTGNVLKIYLDTTPSPALFVGDTITISGQTGSGNVNGTYTITNVGAGTAGSVVTVTAPGGTSPASGNVLYAQQTTSNATSLATYSFTGLSGVTTWQGNPVSSGNPAQLNVTIPSASGNISSVTESGGILTVVTSAPHGLTASGSFSTSSSPETLYQSVNINVPIETGSISSVSATGTTATATTTSAHTLSTGDTVTVSGLTNSASVTLATQNPAAAIGTYGTATFSGSGHTITSITNTSANRDIITINYSSSTPVNPLLNVGEQIVITGCSGGTGATNINSRTITVTNCTSSTITGTVNGTFTTAVSCTNGTFTPQRIVISINAGTNPTASGSTTVYLTGMSSSFPSGGVTAWNLGTSSFYITGPSSYVVSNSTVYVYTSSSLTNPTYVTPAWSSGGNVTFSTYPNAHGFSSGNKVDVSGLQMWNQTVGLGEQGPIVITSIVGNNLNGCLAYCNRPHGLANGSTITISGSNYISGTVTVVGNPGQGFTTSTAFFFNYPGGPSDSNLGGYENIIGYNAISGFNHLGYTVQSVIDSYTFTTDNPNNVSTVPSGSSYASVSGGGIINDASFIAKTGTTGLSNPFDGTFTVSSATPGTTSFQYTISTSSSLTLYGGTWSQPSGLSNLVDLPLITASGSTFTVGAPSGVANTGIVVKNLGTWSQPNGFGGILSYTGGTSNTDGSKTWQTGTQAIGTIFGGTWTENVGNSTTNTQSGVTWKQPTGFNTSSGSTVTVTVTGTNTFTYPLSSSTAVGTVITSSAFGTYATPGNFGVSNIPVTVTGANTFTYNTNISLGGTITGGTWSTAVGFNNASAVITVPSYTISTIASGGAGTAIVTLASGVHYFSGGDTVLISGASASLYNGLFTIPIATPGSNSFTITVSSPVSSTGGTVTGQNSFFYSNNTIGTTFGTANSLVTSGSSAFSSSSATILAVYNNGTQFAYSSPALGTSYGGIVSGTSGFNGKQKVASIVSPTSFTFNYTSGVVGYGSGGTATSSASTKSSSVSLYSVVPTPQNVGLDNYSSVILPTMPEIPMSAIQQIVPDFIMGDAMEIDYNSGTGVTTFTLMEPTNGFVVGQNVIDESGNSLGIINSIVSPTVFTTTGGNGTTFVGSTSTPSYLIHAATINENVVAYVGPTSGGNFYKATFTNPPYHGNLQQNFTGTAGVDGLGNGQITNLVPADVNSALAQLTIGQEVSGEGLPDNAVVTSVSTSSVGLSQAPYYTPATPSTTGGTSPGNNTLVNVANAIGFYEGSQLSGLGIPQKTEIIGVYPQIILSGDVSAGSPTINNVSSFEGLIVGQAFQGVTTGGNLVFPSTSYIVSINTSLKQITISSDALYTQTSCEVYGLPALLVNNPTTVSSGSTLTGKVVYTFGNSPVYFPLQITNYGGSETVSFTGDSTIAGTSINNITDTSLLYEGMNIVGTGIPSNTSIVSVQSNSITLNRASFQSETAQTFLAIPPMTRLAMFVSMSQASPNANIAYTKKISFQSQQLPNGSGSYGISKGSRSVVVNATTANAILAETMPSGGYPLSAVAGLVANGTTIKSIKPNQVAGITTGYTLSLNKPFLSSVTSGVIKLSVPPFAISTTSGSFGMNMVVDSTANFSVNSLITFRNEIYQVIAILSDTEMSVGYPLSGGGIVVPTNQYVSYFTGTVIQGSQSISVSDSVNGIVPGMIVNDSQNSVFPANSAVTAVYTSGSLTVTMSQPASVSATAKFYLSYPNGDNANYIYLWEGGIPDQTFIGSVLSPGDVQPSSGWGVVEVDNATTFDHASGTMVGAYANEGVRYFGTVSAGDYEGVPIDRIGSLTGSTLQQPVSAKDTDFTIFPQPSANTTVGSGFVPLFPSFSGVLAPELSATLYSDLSGSPAVISIPNGQPAPTTDVLSAGTILDSPITFQASVTAGNSVVKFKNYLDAQNLSNGMYVFGEGIPANTQIWNLTNGTSSSIFQMINGSSSDALDASPTKLVNGTKTSVSTITASWLPENTKVTTAIESSFVGSFNISSPTQITTTSSISSIVPGLGVWGSGVTPGTTITSVVYASGTYTITLSMPLTLTASVTNATFQVQGYLLNSESSYVPWSGTGYVAGTGASSGANFMVSAGATNNAGNTIASLPTANSVLYGPAIQYGTTILDFIEQTETYNLSTSLGVAGISSMTYSSGTFVITTSGAHGLAPGEYISVFSAGSPIVLTGASTKSVVIASVTSTTITIATSLSSAPSLTLGYVAVNGNFVSGINLVATNLLQATQPVTSANGQTLSSVAIGAIGLSPNAPLAGYISGQSSLTQLGNIDALVYDNDGDVYNVILDTPYNAGFAVSGEYYSDAYGVVIVGLGANQEAVLLSSPFDYSFVATSKNTSSPINWSLADGQAFQYDHAVGEPVVVPNVLSTRSNP